MTHENKKLASDHSPSTEGSHDPASLYHGFFPSLRKGPVVVKEEGDVKPETIDQLPSDTHLLKLILEQVAAAREDTGRQEKRKDGCYRRLAEIIDYVFFALYFTTVVLLMVTIYKQWIPSDFFS